MAALGLRALSADAERVEGQLRRQASGLARSLVDAFETTTRELNESTPGVFRFAADGDGSLAGGAEPPRNSREVELLVVQREIDALELRGDMPGVLARLASLAEREDVPEVAAWALVTTAALQARAGEIEAAHAAAQRVVEEFPDVADERGLPRGLAARWMSCEFDGFPAAATAELARVAIEHRVSVDQVAVGALIARALEQLSKVDPALHGELRAFDRERQFERRVRSSWTLGISNWLASGAGGGQRWFELVDDPLEAPEGERVFVRVEPAADGWRGVALSAGGIARAAFDRPEIATLRALGFDAGLVAPGARVLAGTSPALDDDSGWERLPPPNDGLLAIARSTDMERARAEARRRFWIAAALSASALFAAACAAWLGLRALVREAQAARQREQFVAAVTHELKAPLASIRLLAELLEQGGVAENKVREFGARTVAEADRLSRLVSSVLEIARLERGVETHRRDEVILRQLALDTLRQFEPLALERRLAVKLHPVDESLRVLAHRDAIGSALFELLTNASKYGAASDVEVSIERRGTRVVLAVLDRGPGIAPSDAERVFEPFQRLGDEMTREQPGVGLGLALVRKVAESHGGSARHVARAGGGSVFELELPLQGES